MGWADKFRRTDSGKGLILNPTAPAPGAKDHSGRELGAGDEVLILSPSTTWRIQALTPVLEPGAPPGLTRLTLVAVAHAVISNGERLEGMYRLRTAGELEPPPAEGEAAPVGTNPPDDKPTTRVVD